jgi:hypothetical protein
MEASSSSFTPSLSMGAILQCKLDIERQVVFLNAPFNGDGSSQTSSLLLSRERASCQLHRAPVVHCPRDAAGGMPSLTKALDETPHERGIELAELELDGPAHTGWTTDLDEGSPAGRESLANALAVPGSTRRLGRSRSTSEPSRRIEHWRGQVWRFPDGTTSTTAQARRAPAAGRSLDCTPVVTR